MDHTSFLTTRTQVANARSQDRRPVRSRRNNGFSIIELLIALTITATLLTSVLVALDASFKAYQSTTESASRHTVARLTMHRLLSLIRTGTQFGPYPANVVTTPEITSDYIEFLTSGGQYIRVEYRDDTQSLYTIVDPNGAAPQEQVLMSGVIPQYDSDHNLIPPFTLYYTKGPKLYRATIDLTCAEDPGVDLTIEGDDVPPLRLIASTMPRNNIY